jgi:hypothetical protein
MAKSFRRGDIVFSKSSRYWFHYGVILFFKLKEDINIQWYTKNNPYTYGHSYKYHLQRVTNVFVEDDDIDDV